MKFVISTATAVKINFERTDGVLGGVCKKALPNYRHQ